ncbi:GspE/PulE family protein [Clostridium lundense]|uniref:GspE/PulE family protein n=1 Tax=Clostridium lundense TaxID=319475 RepID=UPI0009FF10B4|nr:GspE/PulE family protein [Clostridium lundense]
MAEGIKKNIELNVNNEALKYIPLNIALTYVILPYDVVNNTLYLFATDKFTTSIGEELRFISGMDIEVKIIPEYIISASIHKFYYKNQERKGINNLIEVWEKKNEGKKYLHNEKNVVHTIPTIKVTDYIITSAILKKASDIHIEPFKGEVNIRLRIDGILSNFTVIPMDIYYQILRRIKILSFMDATEKRIPQDGKFEYKVEEKIYDLRVSTLPTVNGEKIAIRILYSEENKITLESLGFDKEGVETIKNILGCSQGMVLVTGPTGSGKTTTLYAMLNELDKAHKNVITVEEPVEYSIKGINQVNVNNKVGLTFYSGLKSIIRQDPDVIMIGEIRDEETAEIAVRAAITGHLVLSTLHTKDAPASILRLIDMGIPKYLAADAITAVIAQRLVRKLCPYCNSNNFRYDKKNKCNQCNNSGYLGRTVVYELMKIENKHRYIISKDFSVEKLRDYSLQKGMKSLKENGLKLVKEGITSLEEVERL